MSNFNNNDFNKPIIKSKKKNSFSFYLVLFGFVFVLISSILGLFAFVENRAKADESALVNQINTSHIGTYTSQNFTMQFNSGLYSIHMDSAMTPYTASFPLGTIDRVIRGNYLLVMSNLLPLQGVSILFLSTGANAIIYEQVFNSNNYTFSFPNSAIGTSVNVWLFISPDYISNITNFSFTLSLFNANSAYSLDYLLGYQQGLFQYLSTLGPYGIFTDCSVSYFYTLVGPSSIRLLEGVVPQDSIKYGFGSLYFSYRDFKSICHIPDSTDPNDDYYIYYPTGITLDFGQGVHITNSYLFSLVDNSGLIVPFSSITPYYVFYFDNGLSFTFSYFDYGAISVIDLSIPLKNSGLSDFSNILLTRIEIYCEDRVVSQNLSIYGLSNNSDLALYYNQGYRSGWNDSYSTGYDVGFEQGKLAGYDIGVNDSNTYTFQSLLGAVIDAPVQVLSGLLDFNFLGFNLKNFFFSLVTVAVLIFVIKTFI